jgi:hypothetical protein
MIDALSSQSSFRGCGLRVAPATATVDRDVAARLELEEGETARASEGVGRVRAVRV